MRTNHGDKPEILCYERKHAGWPFVKDVIVLVFLLYVR